MGRIRWCRLASLSLDRNNSQERSNMDLSKFSLGEKIAIVGAVIALISTFLSWYGAPAITYLGYTASLGVSISLWSGHGFAAFLMLIGAVAGAGFILLRVFGIFDISEQGVAEPLAVLVASIVAGVGALWGFLGTSGASREYGMWVGVVFTIVFIVGAVMTFRAENA